VMGIKPKSDKTDLFKKGMAAHNKKFHASGPYKASVSYAITGPNSGQYTWVMGPVTWTQMDGAPGKGEHDMDWEKNVNPFVESYGEISYWRADKELNYTPAGAQPNSMTKSRLRFFTVLPNQTDRFKDALKKVVEMYKKKQYKASYNLVWRQGASGGPHAVAILSFDKWGYLDNGTDFAKDFNEVHGANSFERFREELALCVDLTKTYDELSEDMPDLGGGN